MIVNWTKTIILVFLSVGTVAQQVDLDSLTASIHERSQRDNPDELIPQYLDFLKLAEAQKREDLFSIIYYNLALNNQRLNNLEKSGEYIGLSIEWAERQRDTALLARGFMASAILDFFNKDYELCIEKMRRCADFYQAVNMPTYAALAIAKIGNVYEEQGLFHLATPYFKSFFETAAQSGDSIMVMTAHINLASNDLGLGKYGSALEHSAISLDYARALGRIHEEEQILSLKSSIEEKKGDLQASIQTLREFIAFRDKYLNEESNRQIAELEAKYETEKKEATITQQEAALSQGQIRFWLITGILALTLAGGALLLRLTHILRKRNQEKEFLIKEIHHRVKNNLQVLSSLLYLQSKHIKDDAALDAVREGQNRVEAMSLIHQKLYMGDNLAAVEMQSYLQDLGDTLLDAFRLDEERVKIIYHVQPLRLDVDTAIPLGLIINDLVTNSLKYAFPNGRSGIVEISLWKNENGKLCLRVADDGVGKMAAPPLKNSTSFGSNLVEILSKRLKGKPQVMDGQGYATLIEFENYKSV